MATTLSTAVKAQEFNAPLEQAAYTSSENDLGFGEISPQQLHAILMAGAEASREYSFQPWRFLVVHAKSRIERIQQLLPANSTREPTAAIIVVFTPRACWKRSATAILSEIGKEQQHVMSLVKSLRGGSWLTQQVRKMNTYMNLAARALGWDITTVDDYDLKAVRRELSFKSGMDVISMLAVTPLGDRHKTISSWVSQLAYKNGLEQPWDYSVAATSSG